MSSQAYASDLDRAYDRLHPTIRRWIRDQGWEELREIQARTIISVLDGERDLVIAAATAAGKTEAAFLSHPDKCRRTDRGRTVGRLRQSAQGPDQRSVPPARPIVRADGDSGRAMARRCSAGSQEKGPGEPLRDRADHAGIDRGDVMPSAGRGYPYAGCGRLHRHRRASCLPAWTTWPSSRKSSAPDRRVRKEAGSSGWTIRHDR